MKTLRNISLSLTVVFLLSSFTSDSKKTDTSFIYPGENTEVNWKSFEKSIALKDSGKKYFIFLYTDWCSWCKKMENTTLKDEKIVNLLNEKFVPVMFNAESKESIQFMGNEFKYVSQGTRGYHELAAALTNNQLSYPSIVFLDEQMNMIQPLPGYKSAEDLRIILTFLGDNIYEKMKFDEYYKQETGEELGG